MGGKYCPNCYQYKDTSAFGKRMKNGKTYCNHIVSSARDY